MIAQDIGVRRARETHAVAGGLPESQQHDLAASTSGVERPVGAGALVGRVQPSSDPYGAIRAELDRSEPQWQSRIESRHQSKGLVDVLRAIHQDTRGTVDLNRLLSTYTGLDYIGNGITVEHRLSRRIMRIHLNNLGVLDKQTDPNVTTAQTAANTRAVVAAIKSLDKQALFSVLERAAIQALTPSREASRIALLVLERVVNHQRDSQVSKELDAAGARIGRGEKFKSVVQCGDYKITIDATGSRDSSLWRRALRACYNVGVLMKIYRAPGHYIDITVQKDGVPTKGGLSQRGVASLLYTGATTLPTFAAVVATGSILPAIPVGLFTVAAISYAYRYNRKLNDPGLNQKK